MERKNKGLAHSIKILVLNQVCNTQPAFAMQQLKNLGKKMDKDRDLYVT